MIPRATRIRLGNVKASVLLVVFGGLALAICLFVYYGLEPIGRALAAAGWSGLAALCGVHLLSVLLCALAWRALLVESRARSTVAFVWARWLRDSAGNLLAVLPAAGEVIAARELSLHGIRLSLAGATTIIDLTIEILSQLLFTLLGLGFLLAGRPGAGGAWWAVGGLVVATLAIAGFIYLQRGGLYRLLQKLPAQHGLRRRFEGLVEVARIDAAIQQIYRHPVRIAASIMLHLASWVVAAAETWLGLKLMGYPLSFSDALVIESLVFALRTTAFVVPWAAGVQEGGYLMLGALFGLQPEVSLALALLKRAREIVIGLPALLIWQGIEWRRFLLGSGRFWQRTPSADICEPHS
jgi:putative membrane protein